MTTVTGLVVEVVAARQLSAARAGVLAASLPRTLVGLLEVAPDLTVAIELGSDAVSGRGRVALAVTGPEATARALAAELASSMREAFESHVVVASESLENGNLPTRAWPLIASSRTTLGFGAVGAPAPSEVRWHQPDGKGAEVRAIAVQWLALAAEYPGLTVAVTAGWIRDATPERAVRITAEIRWGGAELPLRARSLAQQLFEGLVVAARPGGEPVALVMARPCAETLLQVPLAQPEALPGVPQAPATPIAVQPTTRVDAADGVRLGRAVQGTGVETDVRLAEDELRRHIHVLGKTGTGKSSTLAAIAHGFASRGNGYLLVDPHGDLVRRVLAELPDEARDRVWLIEAADLENPVRVNPLALADPVQLDIVIQDMVLIFYKLFDPKNTGIVGPRFESYLTNALRGLEALRGTRASILDVARVYRDARLEKDVAEAVTDPRLIEFWRHEMRQLTGSSRSEIVGWITSKFDRFANTAAMRGILGTGADAFDPAVAMDESRIILLDLSKGKLGEVASNLLGFLYLTRFWSSMMTRTTREPFGIIVDEAQSFSAGSLPSMLSEGRKWGASVTIAHQYLAQLDPALADALDGNVATTVAFRTGMSDAIGVRARIGESVAVEALTTQPDLHALMTRTSGEVSPRAHTVVIDHEQRVTARVGSDLARFVDAVRARTRRDLVDPHRSAQPLEPRAAVRARERVPAPRPPVRRPPQQSFLDEWLEQREANQRAAAAAADAARRVTP